MVMLPDASVFKKQEEDRHLLKDELLAPVTDRIMAVGGEADDTFVELQVLRQVLLHQDAAVGDSDDAAEYRQSVDRLVDNMAERLRSDETKDIAQDLLAKLASAALRREPKKPVSMDMRIDDIPNPLASPTDQSNQKLVDAASTVSGSTIQDVSQVDGIDNIQKQAEEDVKALEEATAVASEVEDKRNLRVDPPKLDAEYTPGNLFNPPAWQESWGHWWGWAALNIFSAPNIFIFLFLGWVIKFTVTFFFVKYCSHRLPACIRKPVRNTLHFITTKLGYKNCFPPELEEIEIRSLQGRVINVSDVPVINGNCRNYYVSVYVSTPGPHRKFLTKLRSTPTVCRPMIDDSGITTFNYQNSFFFREGDVTTTDALMSDSQLSLSTISSLEGKPSRMPTNSTVVSTQAEHTNILTIVPETTSIVTLGPRREVSDRSIEHCRPTASFKIDDRYFFDVSWTVEGTGDVEIEGKWQPLACAYNISDEPILFPRQSVKLAQSRLARNWHVHGPGRFDLYVFNGSTDSANQVRISYSATRKVASHGPHLLKKMPLFQPAKRVDGPLEVHFVAFASPEDTDDVWLGSVRVPFEQIPEGPDETILTTNLSKKQPPPEMAPMV